MTLAVGKELFGGLDRATARARFPSIRVEGDTGLGEVVLEMVSVMA